MTRVIGMALIAVAFGALVIAMEKPDADEKDLVGRWVIESVLEDGNQDTPFKGARLLFESGKIEMQFPDGDKATGKYKLDSSKKPKAIDFGIVISETVIARDAIYSLENDTLTIC